MHLHGTPQVSKAQQKMEKKKKAKEFNTSANAAKQGKNAKRWN